MNGLNFMANDKCKVNRPYIEHLGLFFGNGSVGTISPENRKAIDGENMPEYDNIMRYLGGKKHIGRILIYPMYKGA